MRRRSPTRCDHQAPPELLASAPAAARLGVPNRLPDDVTVTVVHGTGDEIVPLEDGRALVAGRDPSRVRLIEIDDGHRLQSLVDSGTLAALVRETRAGAFAAPTPTT